MSELQPTQPTGDPRCKHGSMIGNCIKCLNSASNMASTILCDNLTCVYCGQIHIDSICPKIKSIEYYPNGTINKIEFK
jgi:hypothetical protein